MVRRIRPRRIPALIAVAATTLVATGCGADGAKQAASATAPLTTKATTTFPARPALTTTAAPRSPAAFPPLEPVSATLITHGPRDAKRVALTFDADMTKEMRAALDDGSQKTWINHALFDLLRTTRTPSTIFLTGMWTEYYKSFVRGLARQPRLFELENHSYDHLAWTKTDCYDLPSVDTDVGKQASSIRAG